jgi:predicted transcriptional regulator
MQFGQPSESGGAIRSKSPVGAAAQTGTPPKRRRQPAHHGDVAALRAEGISQATVGKMLGVSQPRIAQIERQPEVAARIQELRDVYTRIAQERITEKVEGAWAMAGEAIEQRDARAFDNTVRGLVGMEKISASVAGVAQRVDVTGAPAPVVDLKVLIANLLST